MNRYQKATCLSCLFTCLMLFHCVPLTLRAQDLQAGKTAVIEDLVEQLARQSDQELDYNTLFNDLSAYYEHPLNLNTASYGELEQLHLLTHFQIKSLQQYISDHGPIVSIHELPQVYGFSARTARQILPFVTLDAPAAGAREPPPLSRGYGRHRLFLRSSFGLQQRKGYSPVDDSTLSANPNARYKGHPVKLYTRYSYSSRRKLYAGFTAEKDAGEEFFSGSNPYGFDYYSAHIHVKDVWKIRDLVVGDYQVLSGQGLSLWTGLSFGKSPDVLNVRKKNQGIRRYASVDENRFFRGLGATMGLGNFDLTGFVSSKRIDANLAEPDSLSDGRPRFTSFQRSGIHALEREIEDERSVRETVAGGQMVCHLATGQLGVSLVSYRFDGIYEPSSYGSDLGFRGSQGMNAGTSYQFSWKKVMIYGEAGINDAGGLAFLNGTSMALTSMVSVSLMHRYFQRDFHAVFGNAFSESTTPGNEHGFYAGIVLSPVPSWTFSGSLDSYSFPWLNGQVAGINNSGYDAQLQADYQISKEVSAYIRYRHDVRPENSGSGEQGIGEVTREYLDRLRIHLAYQVAPAVEFRNRLELSWYDKEDDNQKGYLFYHDILFRPEGARLALTLRYCMFDTDGYDARIYSYEHDVLYAFRILPFHNRGIRTYFNARYRVHKNIDLWLKLSDTWYPDRESISSGPAEIEGRHKTEINLQMRVKIN